MDDAATIWDVDVIVVKNDEDQYSYWPQSRPIPSGWTAVTSPSTRDDCLAYIEKTWIDMRPTSVRCSG